MFILLMLAQIVMVVLWYVIPALPVVLVWMPSILFVIWLVIVIFMLLLATRSTTDYRW